MCSMLVHVVSLGECLILISREFLKSSLKSAESLVDILRAGRVPRLGSWTPRGGQPCLVLGNGPSLAQDIAPVSYTHLRAHETDSYLVCRLLLEKKKKTTT